MSTLTDTRSEAASPGGRRYVMRVTSNGQISLPAEVRRRWSTDRVVVVDTPGGLMIRPFDADAVRSLRGKYTRDGVDTDEGRKQTRAAEAERLDARS